MTWRWLGKGVAAIVTAGIVTAAIIEQWWDERERAH